MRILRYKSIIHRSSSVARAFCLSFTLSLLLCGFAFAQSSYQPLNRELTKDEEKWVRDTMKRLSLEAKIGQMFLADGNAIFMNRQTGAYQLLKHHIEDNKVGGIL